MVGRLRDGNLQKHHVAPSISTTIARRAHPLCLSAGEGRERDLQVVRWGGTHLVAGSKPEKPRLPRPVVISRPNHFQGPVL